MYGFSSIHSCFFCSLMKYFDVYPRSIFIPLIISTCVSEFMLFSTVTMSTSLNASEIILPICLSLFALIDATSNNFLPLTFLLIFSSLDTIVPVMSLISRITSITFSLNPMCLSAALIIASANTIDVVVPSPATVAVLSAA